MTTYADPTRCPDCRAALPREPVACPACSLPLTGQTAASLFSTLQEADRLVGLLRLSRRPAAVPAGTPSAAPTPGTSTGSRLSGAAPYPAPGPHRTVPTQAPRVRGTSVPKILLSLGALCLLVAAVTFLAVAWAWLGVGGRTAVLVVLTGTALGLATALCRRGLRMAAEALAVVGLGLLALDVVGVRHAGWLGQVDGGQLVLTLGTVVASGALVLLVVTSRRPLVAPALVAPALVAPALVAPAAVLVAGLGAQADVDALLPLVVTVTVLLFLGRLGTELPSGPMRVASLAAAAAGWWALVAAAVVGASTGGTRITAAHYLGDLAAWPMLAATVLAAVVGPVTGMRRPVALTGYALAGLVGTYAALLPVVDNAPTARVTAVLGASAAWVAVLLVGPARLRPAAALPLIGTIVVPLAAAARLTERAAVSLLSAGAPFSRPAGVHLSAGHAAVSPLLLVPTAATVAAGIVAGLTLVRPVSRVTGLVAVTAAAGLGGLVAVASYDVPLAVPVGLAVTAGVASLLVAERLAGAISDLARLVALVLMVGAALVALPSDRLTTVVLMVACGLAATLAVRAATASSPTGAAAALFLPVAFTGLVWAGANVAGAPEDVRAVPALLVLGALVIWRPQVELEISSTLAGTIASVAAIVAARDVDVALAVHLTVAGVLVTATSLVHPSRRPLSWPGGLLLAAATWVRLHEIGVHAPEAYTLPSAMVLVAVGAWRLRHDDRSATLSCLAPGLLLATLPSLVATLDEPYSPRALLLGVACVVMTLGGAGARWGAPLVVGAGVGALLVLRELAPYAAQVPSWVVIGASGALLLGVGVTWEQRMNDVRHAGRYLAALR